MTSVAMAFHHGSGVLGARTKAQATAQHGPRSRSASPALVIGDEGLNDLRRGQGLGLGLVFGLGLWGVVGSATWLLLLLA